ncbi:hypothetical protein [Legionella fallonii]|uniref:Uncharacterized protein n=1 Tax=Legionella fallonii LLAP-10 TaxID=1212491 RepID=A0A098G4Q5_9GAMM|nr:hypothetical protein [Legionella fallonii]CEG56465.1 protein of unknown function [Legionella fallonii LLAP-10]
MKELILKKILRQHGFKQEDIELAQDKVKIKIKDVNALELKEEGAPVPGKRDYNYHNYIYPEGLIATIEQIRITFYPATHRFSGRPNTIEIPSAMYKESAETANVIHGTQHNITRNPEQVIITIDYSQGRGTTPADEMINQLIFDLQPRIANSTDIKENINYISDLGRIAPLIGLGLQKEIKDLLLGQKKASSLLQLKDRIVDSADKVTIRTIELDREIFNRYIEKLIREEGYLVQLVRNHLNLDQKNWVLADQNLLNNYLNIKDANAEKLNLALQNKKEPLFISTTTGSHAFAIKVDFARKTLFLANPGEDKRNCEQIIEQLKQMTGCTNVVQVITKKLIREEDISFNDVCTADSLALAQMMIEQDHLEEGCLNNAPLKTGVFVRKALEDNATPVERQSKKTIEKPIVTLLNVPPVENHSERIEPEKGELTQSSEPNSSPYTFNMHLLSGFITALGIAAVAVAFTVLNATTFGISGLVVAGIGIAAILGGVGLFASTFKKNEQPSQTDSLTPQC